MVDSTLFSLATLNAHPAMNPDSVIQGDHWRIGLITDALVRFEWSDSGRFVDDATQMAMVRDFGEKPEFTVTERNGWLEIDTPSLHISYNQRKFSPEGLYATVKHVNAIENTWHYGDVQRRNLGGTYRTLDEANGRIPVDPGVNSTDGWAIIDDSKSNVIRETAEVNGNHNDFGTWVTPKEEPTTDLYLFGYGHRYREAARPVPPDRPDPAAAALRAGQLVEPLPPLYRNRIPSARRTFRKGRHPVHHGRHRYGLAPG